MVSVMLALAILAAYLFVNVARTLAHHHWPRLLLLGPLNCDLCSSWWAGWFVAEVVALYVMEDLAVLLAGPAVGGGCLALVRLLDKREE